jgi:CarD family transcriptional regulator
MEMYTVGDNAVYAGHGVGKIVAIETTEMYGRKQTFYRIQIMETGMKILVPTDNAESRGLRPIISSDEADKVLGIVREKKFKVDNQTWNRRYREYMEKIKTGSVFEIAEVFRDLYLLKAEKELSFGEKKMLDMARGLLLRELALAKTEEELNKEEDIVNIFDLKKA